MTFGISSVETVGRVGHRKSVSASSAFWLGFDEIRLLIIPWSQVRVLAGPPSPLEIIALWPREQGIRVPWSVPLAGVSGSLDSGWASGSRAPLSRPVRTPTRPGPGLPLTLPHSGAPPRRLPRERSALVISRLSALNTCEVDIGAPGALAYSANNPWATLLMAHPT